MTRLYRWYWPKCPDDVWCRIDRNMHATIINIKIACAFVVAEIILVAHTLT